MDKKKAAERKSWGEIYWKPNEYEIRSGDDCYTVLYRQMIGGMIHTDKSDNKSGLYVVIGIFWVPCDWQNLFELHWKEGKNSNQLTPKATSRINKTVILPLLSPGSRLWQRPLLTGLLKINK